MGITDVVLSLVSEPLETAPTSTIMASVKLRQNLTLPIRLLLVFQYTMPMPLVIPTMLESSLELAMVITTMESVKLRLSPDFCIEDMVLDTDTVLDTLVILAMEVMDWAMAIITMENVKLNLTP